MHQDADHKREVIQRSFTYALMSIIVSLLVIILLFIVQGYQYNQKSGQIEQGGLLQCASKPSGASVSVNGNTLGSRTDTRYYGLTDDYTVAYNRDGYATWQKTVTLKPGAVVWLNYARLIPDKLTNSTVANFSAIDSSLRSPNNRSIIAITDPKSASLSLISLTSDTPTITPLILPNSSYSPGTSGTFKLAEWDKTSRYVLLRHDLAGKIEWLVVDTSNIQNTINLASRLNSPAESAHFAYDGGQIIYSLTSDHKLYKVDTGSTSSAAAVVGTNVASFQISHRSFIAYTSLPDVTSGKTTVGYFDAANSAAPKVVSSLTSSGLTAAAAHYYDADYFAYSTDTGLVIRDLTHGATVATLPITGVTSLHFSPSGRFVLATQANKTTVYDLELTTTATLSQTTTTWLDDYYQASIVDGKLQIFEFDGTNNHTIGAGINQAVLLTDDGRYLYHFATSGTDTSLMRTQLIL